MNINHCIMLNYHGLFRNIHMAINEVLSPFVKLVKVLSTAANSNKINNIFLKFVKNKLMLYKAQWIYYFNLFNERLSKWLEISQEKEEIGDVSIFIAIVKFEKPY